MDDPQIMDWEPELAGLLGELSSVQDELLDVLTEKRRLLAAADTEGMAAMAPREERIMERLGQCQRRREELLARADREGLPSESIGALASALPPPGAAPLKRRIRDASARFRLLQHHGLTNWVVVQRTLIHLAQMLEIIATGGQPKPTYEKSTSPAAGGSLIDQAV